MGSKTPKLTVAIALQMPRWPNYILHERPPRLRQDGVSFDGAKTDVADLTPEQIEALCEDFRRHCAARREETKGEERRGE